MEYLQYDSHNDALTWSAIVLNLIINGIPSIHILLKIVIYCSNYVLNLIINGIPSILRYHMMAINV